MRKLGLDPESISVQSFATHDARGNARGTVRAHEFFGGAMSTEERKCLTSISGCVTYCTCPNTQEL